MDDYFELTDKGIVIKDETLMLVPCFNEVYKRDLSDDKRQAFKELYYIFQVSDIRSTSLKRGLKGKRLSNDAIKITKLGKDYIADVVVNECIAYYKADRSNISITSYTNLLNSFGTANESIEFLDDILRHKIAMLKTLDDSSDDDGNSVINSDTIQLITSSIKELLSLGTAIPKMIKDLEGIKDRALSLNKGSGIGRGDIEITDSMNPMNSVLNR